MKFIEFIKSMQKWIIKLNRKEVQKKIGKFQFFLFIGLLILTLRFVCIFADNMFTIKSKYDILKIVNTAKKKWRTK